MTPALRAVTSERLPARLRSLAHVERVPVGGGQVTWRRMGSGPPLVLLHGGHGSWLHWVRNIEALAARYCVWTPDLPGYGDSDAPGGSALEDLAEATLTSLDALIGTATPFRLAGFSFGGLVAAWLAQQRSGVSHLALLGPAGHGGERRPRGELRPWRGFEAKGAAWVSAMRHNLLMHMLHSPEAIDFDAIDIHGTSCLRTRFHSKSISRAGGLAQRLADYAGPVFLAWGEHDVTAVPSQVAAALSRSRSHCDVHIIPDAGHWVQYEAPGPVNHLLLDWLEDNPRLDRHD